MRLAFISFSTLICASDYGLFYVIINIVFGAYFMIIGNKYCVKKGDSILDFECFAFCNLGSLSVTIHRCKALEPVSFGDISPHWYSVYYGDERLLIRSFNGYRSRFLYNKLRDALIARGEWDDYTSYWCERWFDVTDINDITMISV